MGKSIERSAVVYIILTNKEGIFQNTQSPRDIEGIRQFTSEIYYQDEKILFIFVSSSDRLMFCLLILKSTK